MYVIKNVMIYDYHRFIKNGYVIFDSHIQEVGDMSQYKEEHKHQIIDGNNKIILPGFVSGHTHLYSTFARGLVLPFNPQNFTDILKQMWWKLDHYLDLEMIFHSALMGGINQVLNGTTTLVDHHASHLVRGSLEQIRLAINDQLGMRAILAFETSDRFSIEASIEENHRFINNHHNKQISGMFGMHASLSLSDESLLAIKEKLHGQGIHVHVAESLQDQSHCLKHYQMRVVERLAHFGLLNQHSLLVHCTHINEVEMDIIKKYGATIAINPTSNLNNAVGISQVKKFLEKGIPVIVGNDGLIQNQPMEYLNTFYLQRFLHQTPMAFDLNDVLKLIHHTYDFVNHQLGTSLGRISKDSEADLLMLDYRPYTEVNHDNIFGHVFYGLYPGFKPEKVFINGKLVVDHYQVMIDELVFQKAKESSNKLWQIIKKEGVTFEFENKF